GGGEKRFEDNGDGQSKSPRPKGVVATADSKATTTVRSKSPRPKGKGATPKTVAGGEKSGGDIVAGGGDGGVTAGSGRSPSKKRQRPRFSAPTSTAQEHDVRAPATPGSPCSNPSRTMDEVVPQVQQKDYSNGGGEEGGGLPSLGTW
ncbi:unnamed protein product, partial [Ectocarpus sp. 12 AP-2014]